MMEHSLDTPAPPGQLRVLSGHNFREVAPEMLSPLSWSLIGWGMEHGYRTLARMFGGTPLDGLGCVGYVAFRPFHDLTATERLIESVPWLSSDDLWQLFYGGPRPLPAAVTARPWLGRRCVTASSVAAGQVRLVADIGTRLRELTADVAGLERGALDPAVRRRASPWTVADDAFEIARRCWALHLMTTSMVLGAVGGFRRIWLSYLGDEDLATILATAATTSAGIWSGSDSLLGGAGPGGVAAAYPSYEVLPTVPPFDREVETDAQFGRVAATGATMPIVAPDPIGRILRAAARLVQSAVSERERSKWLALRAQNVFRQAVDDLADEVPHDVLAFLGWPEAMRLDDDEMRRRADRRRDEARHAATLDVAVDLVVEGGRYEPILRSRSTVSDGTITGRGLSAGLAWGRAITVDGDDEAAPRVLCGRRVTALDVLARRPAAVVAELASAASHVAIVCRELDVPLVAGIAPVADLIGRDVIVDGTQGTVTMSVTS